ncbi:MAG TPA: hypothetical protein PK110_15495 [Niabella sp.]|jgi:hypothetical protein|nr:hypothetical protein [Chitinophagaceae bacterium]HRN49124.1 hypothetical protein [Niabella sp.]HRO86226.1 hypothetical protein [Niabella sp.]HUN03675.1 hypothetical protein [Niabella sp.]
MDQQELDNLKQQEYQEELKKKECRDYKFNWVSSSRYLFYLLTACFFLMTWGGCYRLYTKRFEKPKVQIQESTLYTPKYK